MYSVGAFSDLAYVRWLKLFERSDSLYKISLLSVSTLEIESRMAIRYHVRMWNNGGELQHAFHVILKMRNYKKNIFTIQTESKTD